MIKNSNPPYEHYVHVIEAALSTLPDMSKVNIALAMHDPHYELASMVGQSAAIDMRESLTPMPMRWHSDALLVSGMAKTPDTFRVLQKASFAAGRALHELGYIAPGRMYE